MNKTLSLTKYFGKTLLRDKTIIILIVLLPILLVLSGAFSAPGRTIPLELDDKIITPYPNALEISVALYAMTSVILTASVVSFFLGFNLNHLIPRLKQMNYSSFNITVGFILIVFTLNLLIVTAISLFSSIWVDYENFLGYFLGLFLGSILFSTLGLILAEIADTVTLGLYSILTLSVIDTAFLENPIYSRRYNEGWTFLAPAHESVKLLLRSIYDTNISWTKNLWIIGVYELVLIIIYGFVINKGFNSSKNN